MISISLNELILMTVGSPYTLQSSLDLSNAHIEELETDQALPFDQVIVDEVELSLPVHLYPRSNDRCLDHSDHLMVMMPSAMIGSSVKNIGHLKINFKIC